MRIRVLCLLGIVALTGGLRADENPGNPREIGAKYKGTKDIDVLVSLVYYSFADFNPAFFKSLQLKTRDVLEGEKKAYGKVKHITPQSAVKFVRIWHHPLKDKRYSFHHLPKGAKFLHIIRAEFPQKNGGSMTAIYPVAVMEGKLYLVEGFYKKKSDNDAEEPAKAVPGK